MRARSSACSAGTRVTRDSWMRPMCITGRGRPTGIDLNGLLLHCERDLHDRLAPLQVQERPFRVGGREVECQRFHERCPPSRLRLHLEPQRVLGLAGVGDVEHVRRPAENQRPFVGAGDRPDTVLPRGERLSSNHHVPAQRDRGGRVGARTPHLAPRHHPALSEERPAPRARPVVDDRHLSRADELSHHGVLAPRGLRPQGHPRHEHRGRRRSAPPLHRASPTTGFRNTPTPGISTSTTSPGASGPTPAGVPVAIRSPGSRVMTCETTHTSVTMENTMSRARPCWRCLPFTRQYTSSSSSRRASTGTTRGPTGQNVSKPFALVHCSSVRCRSRAVTSLTHVIPAMPARASLSVARRSGRPMTTPISPSKSTCCDSGGSTIAAPSPMTVVGGFKNRSGLAGTVFPSSAAWSR